MNEIATEVSVNEMPLPETQRELELLLDALRALNEALDQYDTPQAVNA